MWHPLRLGCICCCLKETIVIENNNILHVFNLSVKDVRIQQICLPGPGFTVEDNEKEGKKKDH